MPMASNVFPMLSSSPPPMDDCPEDDEEDEEFGNFTAALPYDSSFDSPVSNKIQQFKSCDNEDAAASSFVDNKRSFNKSLSPGPQETSSSAEKESQLNGFIPSKNSFLKSSTDNLQVTDQGVKISRIASSSEDSSHLTSNSLTSDSEQHSVELSNCSKNSLCSESAEFEQPSVTESSNCVDSSVSFLTINDNVEINKTSNDVNVSGTHIAWDSEENRLDDIEDDSFSNFPKSKETSGRNPCTEIESDIDDIDENIADLQIEVDSSKCDAGELQHGLSLKTHENKSITNVELNSSSTRYDDESSISEDNFHSHIQDQDLRPHKRIDLADFGECSDNGLANFQNSDSQSTLNLNNQSQAVQNLKTDRITPVESNDSEFQFLPESDKEFLNFSDSPSLKNPVESYETLQDDDDFDDFQTSIDHKFTDFQGSSNEQSSCHEFADFQESSGPKVFDADFSDFQDCSNFREEEQFANFQSFSGDSAGTDDEFADFSVAPFQSGDAQLEGGDSEFSDFATAPPDISSERRPSQTFLSQKPLDPLSTVINTVFPYSEEYDEEAVSGELSSQILEQSNKSRRLWEKLQEVEQVPSLRFQWGVSHSFQQLLRSVNVDYHSILRTSSVPIFASGLSLLEPVKGQTNLANGEFEDRNHKPKDPIPPVHFDWNSSGLINPLDSGHVASTLMDLSFLSSVKTNSSATTSDHSFENELLKPCPVLQSPDTSVKTPILEQLLLKNVSSFPNPCFTHRPSNLSEEAVIVLDRLPDLSFMQAKVLMFPIISNKT